MAVKCFFFLSGLLITNSLRKNPSVIHYLISRIFRILPPLIFVLMVITFLFGPFLSVLPVSQYFSSPETWGYFIKGSFLKIQYYLPGVFSTMEHNSVNGSLWTLPIEFRYYLLLLAFSLLTGFKKNWLVNLVLGIVLLESLFGERIILHSFGDLPISNLLPVSFFFGVFLEVNAEHITLLLFWYHFYLASYFSCPGNLHCAGYRHTLCGRKAFYKVWQDAFGANSGLKALVFSIKIKYLPGCHRYNLCSCR